MGLNELHAKFHVCETNIYVGVRVTVMTTGCWSFYQVLVSGVYEMA